VRALVCGVLFLSAVVAAPAAGWGATTETTSSDELKAWPLYEPCVSTDAAEEGTKLDEGGLSHPQPSVRVAIIDRLVKRCRREAIDSLLGALSDDVPEVRVAAVLGLGTLRYPQSSDERNAALAERLIALASDRDWRVRSALSRTLASFQLYPASNAVLNLIANPGTRPVVDGGDMRARCAAILMVNQLRDVRFSRKAIGFLTFFADSDDPALGTIVRLTVEELKSTRNGYHELVAMARKPGIPSQRVRAIEWLLLWRMPALRPIFEEIATREVNARVREAASHALAKLSENVN